MPRYSEATLAAIKHAVDIVALVGEYLPLHRSGSKFKALCPFHDDHNPSLELNPERQSFKCWSCGAGGDVFDFVKEYERVEFPEALRMLAERAGVALEIPSAGPASKGPSKTELLAVNAWAARAFAEALARSPEALEYLESRGIDRSSSERFGLGYAPEARDWLATRARRQGFDAELLERAGLVSRSPKSPGLTRERFRGRLIFPIHDFRGRTLGFGGRILPEAEAALAAQGKKVAKYLNSPETVLFLKRRVLYAADLARPAARESGWVAVVEGYTDVIAAHQVGLTNVVGTLGTALGDDHVIALRRLADRVVLVFDGDEAGQSAADRSLELFLGHEVDVRVLTLPANLDPCDFLLKEGPGPSVTWWSGRSILWASRSTGPRRGSTSTRSKDRGRLRNGCWRSLPEFPRHAMPGSTSRWPRRSIASRSGSGCRWRRLTAGSSSCSVPPAVRPRAIGVMPLGGGRCPAGADRRADPSLGPRRHRSPVDPNPLERAESGRPPDPRVAVSSIRDAPLRTILQVCYDLYGEGQTPTFERVALRLDDPEVRSLAAGLLLPIEPAPLPESVRPAPLEDRLAGVLAKLVERDWQDRLRDLAEALEETDATAHPEAYQALQREQLRVQTQRPDTKKKSAS